MRPPHQHRILYLDDNPILLACLGDYLRFYGFQVDTALNAKDAFKKMKKNEPDLIIVDPVMPKKRGIKFLKELTSRTGHLRYPVLVYTAHAEMEKFYASTGVDAFLCKTAPEQALVKSAKDILAKKGRHLTFDAEELAERPAKQAPPPAAEPPREQPAGAMLALLVEDEERVFDDIKRALGRAGIRVEPALSRSQLLEKAAKLKPDVILTKEVLSGTSGSLLATELADSETTRGIPLVIYDATNTISDRVVHRLEKVLARLRIVRSAKPADIQQAIEALGVTPRAQEE